MELAGACRFTAKLVFFEFELSFISLQTDTEILTLLVRASSLSLKTLRLCSNSLPAAAEPDCFPDGEFQKHNFVSLSFLFVALLLGSCRCLQLQKENKILLFHLSMLRIRCSRDKLANREQTLTHQPSGLILS